MSTKSNLTAAIMGTAKVATTFVRGSVCLARRKAHTRPPQVVQWCLVCTADVCLIRWGFSATGSHWWSWDLGRSWAVRLWEAATSHFWENYKTGREGGIVRKHEINFRRTDDIPKWNLIFHPTRFLFLSQPTCHIVSRTIALMLIENYIVPMLKLRSWPQTSVV